MYIDPETKGFIKSAQRSHRAATKRKLKQIGSLKSSWVPNDGRPIIGVNEGSDRKENPYVVLRTITYQHKFLHPISIGKGFKTDLGSIPWLLKAIRGFRPTDPGMRSFLMHDAGYRHQLADRILVDAAMWAGLIEDGMTRWQAWICYMGVRLFGGRVYAKHKAKHKANQPRKSYGEPD